jgi:hypothetical protein
MLTDPTKGSPIGYVVWQPLAFKQLLDTLLDMKVCTFTRVIAYSTMANQVS